MTQNRPNEHSEQDVSREPLQTDSFFSLETPPQIQALAEALKKFILGFNAADVEQLRQQNIQLQETLSHLDESVLKTLAEQVEEQLKTFDHTLHDPTQLTPLLVPCITDVLDCKIQQSKAEVIQSLLPIIDELVRLKAQQNQQAMSQAISTLIPLAIQHQIKVSPQTIAQAIAPEMGAAIHEQIRLDQDQIITALAPTMGKAIQEQIVLEQDAMVDALYPVIGSTISRYLGEALQEINQKVETALSFEGITRKIKAKIQGISEAELILKEAMKGQVQAVFLIHKASGLLITELQNPKTEKRDSDMLAGMLTAIRSFVNDCVKDSQEIQELNEIEYGDSRILIEVAGYCYLAVIVQGEPTKQLIKNIRTALTEIIQNYGQMIQEFDGDPDRVPEAITEQLQPIMISKNQPRKPKFPFPLLFLLMIILGIIFIPWTMAEAKRKTNHQAEQNALQVLTTEPELALYRFNATATNQTLTLTGKVPSQKLRQHVETVVQAALPHWQLKNEIIAVKVPPNPEQVEAEVQRTTAVLNQINGISIATESKLPKVQVQGTVIRPQDIETVIQAFEQIDGVESVNSQLSLEPFPIKTRIYFKPKSAKVPLQDLEKKLRPIAEYLKQYPGLRIQIIGYTNRQEQARCQDLGLRRSQAIQIALEDYGIDRRRMEATQNAQLPPGVAKNQPQWLNQTVVFEIISQ